MGKTKVQATSDDSSWAGLKLDDLFAHSTDNIVLLNRDFTILWANFQAEEQFGPKLAGKKCYTAFKNEQKKCRPECHVARTFADGQHHNDESVSNRDGTRRHFQKMATVARWRDDGRPEMVLNVCRDVTLQKQLTAALMESEKLLVEDLRFKNAILATQQENSLDGILVLDRNGKVLSCNQRFIDLLRIPIKGAAIPTLSEIREAFTRLVAKEEEQANCVEKFLAQTEGKSRDEIEFTDGRTIDRYSVPMLSMMGDYYGRICYFRDITLQKETEKKLLDRARQIEEANISMKILLRQTVEARQEMEERIAANIRTLILPTLNDLEVKLAGAPEKAFVDAVKDNILNIASSFSRELNDKMISLTPRETQVVNLVRQGHCTKDIARLLGVSLRTVEFYRESIRDKFGIRNKKVNLRTYMNSVGKTT